MAMDFILVKDDSATPVERTFIPVTDSPDCVWRTALADVGLEGQFKITMSATELKNKGFKTTLKVEVPVMEVVATTGTSTGYVAPPKVADVVTVIITMFSSARSIASVRSSALKIALGIASGATATTATGTLNQVSGGNAFAGSWAPGVVLFTQSMKPF